MTKNPTPLSGNGTFKLALTEHCEDGSVRAACIAEALHYLMDHLLYSNNSGLAHVVDLLAQDAKALSADLGEIPTKLEGASYE